MSGFVCPIGSTSEKLLPGGVFSAGIALAYGPCVAQPKTTIAKDNAS